MNSRLTSVRDVAVGDSIKHGSVWFEVCEISEREKTREFVLRAPGWPEYRSVKRMTTRIECARAAAVSSERPLGGQA